MLCPPLSVALALVTASLLPGGLGLCGRPSWARVGWDVLPEELEQLGTGTEHQRSCLPYPLDQLWPSCAQLEMTPVTLQVLSLCSQALGLLGGLLLARCLWRKAMRRQRQEMGQAPSAPGGTACQGGSPCDSYEVLCQLEANTALMVKHLRQLCHRHTKEGRLQRPTKERKVEDVEAEERLFSAPTYSRTSSVAPGVAGD